MYRERSRFMIAAAALLFCTGIAGLSGCNGSGGSGGATGTASTSSGTPTGGGVGNNSADTSINTDAMAAVAADASLKGQTIKLTTSGAQVSMDGTVSTLADKNAAEKDVVGALSKYASVNAGVIDNLMVKQGTTAGAGQ